MSFFLACRLPLVLLATTPLFADFGVTLFTPSSAPQSIGTPVTFIARATGTSDSVDYQFRVSYNGGADRVIQDYDIGSTFVFAPYLAEGVYQIEVTARDTVSGSTTTAQRPFVFSSRVSGNRATVSRTANPLVALYSAPSCPAGSSLFVLFANGNQVNKTNTQNCNGATSMNFYVAGMRANTTYVLRPVTVTNGAPSGGALSTFTTGAVDPSVPFPTTTLIQPPNTQTSLSQAVLLLDPIGDGLNSFPAAYDLTNQVIWYLGRPSNPTNDTLTFIRPLAGGTIISFASAGSTLSSTGQILRIYDLAGNIMRQTSVANVNRQLAAAGELGVNDFDHDALLLPNGHILVIGSQENIFPAGTQGSTGPVDILGDAVIDLDPDFRVAWYWSGYDHLDINRPAVLGETCTNGPGGCPPVLLAPVANDWLHANCLNYISSSGDILLSLRHQDWVAKIDYQNGAGGGTVLWELGAGGNWTINSSVPYPWFSHQHDVEYELGGTSVLSLYDNGNTRVSLNPGEDSRGMVLNMDEANLICTPSLLVDLGHYSMALGSAQRLNNANYFFESGFVTDPNQEAYSTEVLPDGTFNFQMKQEILTYRGYRMDSLYQMDK